MVRVWATLTTEERNSGYSKAPCGHWAYQIIYQKDYSGIYEEKKVCLMCKEEIKGY